MFYKDDDTTAKTVYALINILKRFTDYDKLVDFLNKASDKGVIDGYSVNIVEFWDGDAKERGLDGSDGFDMDFGLMGFTIYRDNVENGWYLSENASYYIYDTEDDITEIEDIELGDDINEQIKGL